MTTTEGEGDSSSIHQIARATYVLRIEQMRRLHRARMDGALDFMIKMLILLAPFGLSLMVGGSCSQAMMVVLIAVILFWPELPPSSSSQQKLHFPQDATAAREPSYDMHLQDVAHRMAYHRAPFGSSSRT